MAALGEVPFGQYYGGVDTTPLFIMLAGAYAQRTGDMALIDASGLRWWRRWPGSTATAIRTRTASSTTRAVADTGLANQGWKDSHDSMFHADGSYPERADRAGRGAGLRVRRAARDGVARRAPRRRDDGAALAAAARKALRSAVEERFWLPDAKYYAIALDGDGQPCRVRASNAGQLLYAELPSPRRARRW